jgi:hypothetical protein
VLCPPYHAVLAAIDERGPVRQVTYSRQL